MRTRSQCVGSPPPVTRKDYPTKKNIGRKAPLEEIDQEKEDHEEVQCTKILSEQEESLLPESLPYKEVRTKEGRLGRVCQGNALCPNQGQIFYKIDRLEQHLKENHGFNEPVKHGISGRPVKGNESQKAANVDIYLQQRKKRFLDGERKFSLAKAAYEKRKNKEADLKWENQLSDFERATYTCREEYVEKFVETKMVCYMAEKESKMIRIEATIAKGWEINRRKKEATVETIEECTREDVAEMKDDLVDATKTASLEVPTGVECPTYDSKARQKLQVKRQVASVAQSVVMTLSPCTSPVHVKLISSAENQFLEVYQEEPAGKKKRARGRTRMECNASMELKSKVSNLRATLNRYMLDCILNHEEACTNIMNAFGMWLENTIQVDFAKMIYFVDCLWFPFAQEARDEGALLNLIGNVDISEYMFLFFPIVLRGHWSLFTLYNPKFKKIPKLDGTKMSLLYLDSFGNLVNPFECIGSIHRVLALLAPMCKNVDMSHSLAYASTEVEFKCFKVPQQPNGVDCGYYVMAYCKKFINDVVLGKKKTKQLLTEEWFQHKDVEDLKKGLHAWCADILK